MFVIYTLLRWSWRIDLNESDFVKNSLKNNTGFILAHWHGDEFGILHLLRRYHTSCIISTSKDGELMNKAVQLLGGATSRGSSTRGGSQALKGILRLLKEGRRPSVAVDGPKGPIYKVKPGVLQISRLSRLPIVPISFYASKSFVFEKSWNKSQLPLPFARVTICLGEKMDTVGKDQDSKSEELALLLEQKINDTKKMAETLGKKNENIY